MFFEEGGTTKVDNMFKKMIKVTIGIIVFAVLVLIILAIMNAIAQENTRQFNELLNR